MGVWNFLVYTNTSPSSETKEIAITPAVCTERLILICKTPARGRHRRPKYMPVEGAVLALFCETDRPVKGSQALRSRSSAGSSAFIDPERKPSKSSVT